MNPKKSYSFLFLFLLLSITNEGFAQSQDELNVKNTIETFFNGMRQGDVELIKTTLGENCKLNTVQPADKGSNVKGSLIEDFLKGLSTKDPSVIYDEKILSYDIKVDGPMAIAWTPYNFYINDRFSHCGINVFTLAQGEGNKWSIISITDTRRKEPCQL